MSASVKLTRTQANALRLSARDGLWWDGACWAWGDLSAGGRVVLAGTVDALDRLGCVNVTRSNTIHPSDTGRAWLVANPDPAA